MFAKKNNISLAYKAQMHRMRLTVLLIGILVLLFIFLVLIYKWREKSAAKNDIDSARNKSGIKLEFVRQFQHNMGLDKPEMAFVMPDGSKLSFSASNIQYENKVYYAQDTHLEYQNVSSDIHIAVPKCTIDRDTGEIVMAGGVTLKSLSGYNASFSEMKFNTITGLGIIDDGLELKYEQKIKLNAAKATIDTLGNKIYLTNGVRLELTD